VFGTCGDFPDPGRTLITNFFANGCQIDVDAIRHRELAALTDVRGCCSSSPLAHVDDVCLAWRLETPELGSTNRPRNRNSMENLGFTVAGPDTSDAQRLSRPVWPRGHGRSLP
jgi:hypothetical protein